MVQTVEATSEGGSDPQDVSLSWVVFAGLDVDLDLVAHSADGSVQWYENQGGTGTFGPALSVTAAGGQ